MKLKNNKLNVKNETLKDLFKVGDVLKVNQSIFDGRSYDTSTHYVTLTKINKVTAYGTQDDGTEVILDESDLMNAAKVLQREILA